MSFNTNVTLKDALHLYEELTKEGTTINENNYTKLNVQERKTLKVSLEILGSVERLYNSKSDNEETSTYIQKTQTIVKKLRSTDTEKQSLFVRIKNFFVTKKSKVKAEDLITSLGKLKTKEKLIQFKKTVTQEGRKKIDQYHLKFEKEELDRTNSDYRHIFQWVKAHEEAEFKESPLVYPLVED
ncbi:MAG: hypothetical protein Tsb0021_08290 [Chlamydiales bacterium]